MMCPRLSFRMAPARALWLGWGLALTLLVVGGPHGAQGQTPDVQALVEQGRQAGADVAQMRTVAERARQAGFSPEATASLLRPAVELAEQDLPASPFLSKTLEGLTKRVPLSRLQPVLRQLRTHTERAGQLVSEWMQRAEVREMIGPTENAPGGGDSKGARTQMVVAVTEAQQQNMSPKALDAFLNGLPSAVQRRPVHLSEVATAVSVMPDLPGSKTSPEATGQLLTAALNANYSPESLRQLPVALRSARRKSQRPASALVRGTAQAIARGTPASDVLQGLFQGSPPGGGPPAGVGNGPPGKGPGSGKPPGQGGTPPGTGPPDNPPGGGGPPDNPPGGGGSSL